MKIGCPDNPVANHHFPIKIVAVYHGISHFRHIHISYPTKPPFNGLSKLSQPALVSGETPMKPPASVEKALVISNPTVRSEKHPALDVFGLVVVRCHPSASVMYPLG
jgi:hypothetical protein